MDLKPFRLERYFAKYEFSVKYLLSSSDCDGLIQNDLVNMADSKTKKIWDELSLGYTESLGHPLLREEVANLYTGVMKDLILIVVPEEGIFLTINSILRKGDHVVCTFPGYQSLYEVADGLGCEVTKWMPEEENGWYFNPEFLKDNIKTNTKLIIVNFPHNPTGYLPSNEDFQKIIDIARHHDLYLLSDEMYRFLELDENDRLPSACEVYDKAISLFGMSKTFGMAGVRLGWVITKDNKLFDKMAAFKDYTTICSSAPSEILSIIALQNKEKIIGNHLKRIKRNLDLLDKFFGKHKERFTWVQPKAGTIAFPKIINEESSSDFCQRVVEEANIMLLPSTVYDYDDKHFRVGFGRENMPEALQKLDKYLSSN